MDISKARLTVLESIVVILLGGLSAGFTVREVSDVIHRKIDAEVLARQYLEKRLEVIEANRCRPYD